MNSRILLPAILLGLASGLQAEEAPTVALPPPEVPAGEESEVPAGEDAAEAPPSARTESQVSPAATPSPTAPDLDALFETGRSLFDAYAPDDIKAEYEFPSKDQWDSFFKRLQTALDSDSFEKLSSMEPEVRDAIVGLRALPSYSGYGDWLEERLDLIQAAQSAQTPLPSPSPKPSGLPSPSPFPVGPTPIPPLDPTPKPAPIPNPAQAVSAVPYLDVWKERIRNRPRPTRGDDIVPALKTIFASEGIPAALVWLAEVESSFNPEARSPAGAHGLFQLMPATAKALGLSTFPFDERTHPEKSAQAAAKLLKMLHARYNSWPLALAAYNAGEGRIARALKKEGPGATFADIAPQLSVETRMYVPKVLATISLREGVSLARKTPSALGDQPLVSFAP